MPTFKKSTRKNTKYMVVSPGGKLIHFGNSNYEQYRDKIGLYSKLDHGDPIRRKSYLARAKGIRNKSGELTWKNKEFANYYSIHYLW